MAVDLFQVNPKLVDVDFDRETIDGFRGLIVDPAEKSEAPQFRAEWIIPRAEWKDRIEQAEREKTALPFFRKARNNQSPESSCVYNAAEVVSGTMRNVMLGEKWSVKSSPMSGYCRATKRRNSGSTMWGALQNLKAGVRGNGFLPEKNPRNIAMFGDFCVHQNTPFIPNNGQGHFPEGWEDIAQWFTVVEWYSIDSYEEFISALIRGWGVCYGRSGHSIAGMQAVWHKNQAICKYLDSYGHGRGEDGYLFDSPNKMATGGAWCCREVILPPNLARPWEPCGNQAVAKILTKEQFLALDGLGIAA